MAQMMGQQKGGGKGMGPLAQQMVASALENSGGKQGSPYQQHKGNGKHGGKANAKGNQQQQQAWSADDTYYAQQLGPGASPYGSSPYGGPSGSPYDGNLSPQLSAVSPVSIDGYFGGMASAIQNLDMMSAQGQYAMTPQNSQKNNDLAQQLMNNRQVMSASPTLQNAGGSHSDLDKANAANSALSNLFNSLSQPTPSNVPANVPMSPGGPLSSAQINALIQGNATPSGGPSGLPPLSLSTSGDKLIPSSSQTDVNVPQSPLVRNISAMSASAL